MAWRKLTDDELRTFDEALPDDARLERAKMFGLPHGKVGGHMFAGRHGSGVAVRLPEKERAALLLEGAGPFAPMPGRPMKEWVLLSDAMAADPRTLRALVKKAFDHAAALAPKQKAGPKATPSRRRDAPRQRATSHRPR
jgi:hypothetical protein